MRRPAERSRNGRAWGRKGGALLRSVQRLARGYLIAYIYMTVQSACLWNYVFNLSCKNPITLNMTAQHKSSSPIGLPLSLSITVPSPRQARQRSNVWRTNDLTYLANGMPCCQLSDARKVPSGSKRCACMYSPYRSSTAGLASGKAPGVRVQFSRKQAAFKYKLRACLSL
jgi:hypothetical protein